MNEDELKELWKNTQTNDFPTIDFERFQINLNSWQGKLRNKIRLEFLLGLVMFIALIPVFFYLPDLLYYLPLILITSIWYYGTLWRIYKENTNFDGSKSTKQYIELKYSKLTSFLFWMRIMSYTTSPLVVFSSLFFNMTLEQISEYWIGVLLLLVVIQIAVVAFCEIYFRIMYIPSIRKSRELLKQLESE